MKILLVCFTFISFMLHGVVLNSRLILCHFCVIQLQIISSILQHYLFHIPCPAQSCIRLLCATQWVLLDVACCSKDLTLHFIFVSSKKTATTTTRASMFTPLLCGWLAYKNFCFLLCYLHFTSGSTFLFCLNIFAFSYFLKRFLFAFFMAHCLTTA